MNALINLKDCREYMTITLNNKDHRIKLSGTIDDPYFCGRNVWYSRKSLNNPNEVGGGAHPNSLGSSEPLNYHEGKTVYINESGLYSLILSSQNSKDVDNHIQKLL